MKPTFFTILILCVIGCAGNAKIVPDEISVHRVILRTYRTQTIRTGLGYTIGNTTVRDYSGDNGLATGMRIREVKYEVSVVYNSRPVNVWKAVRLVGSRMRDGLVVINSYDDEKMTAHGVVVDDYGNGFKFYIKVKEMGEMQSKILISKRVFEKDDASKSCEAELALLKNIRSEL